MEQEGIQFLYQVLDIFALHLFPGNPFHFIYYVIMSLFFYSDLLNTSVSLR